MNTPSGTVAHGDLHTLLQRQIKAALAKDLADLMALYCPDVVAFDAIGALQHVGRDVYRKHWESCFAMCPGAGTLELHDLHTFSAGDIAFGHWLARCGPEADAPEKTCWMRVTSGFKKVDGQWYIVHEHWSTPFDMETGQAAFNTKP